MKKTNTSENKPLERRIILMKLIKEKLKNNPSGDNVVLKISELNKYDLLTNIDKLKTALEKIKIGVGEDFVYEFSSRPRISSVADFESKNTNWIPESVQITVEDQKNFDIYETDQKRELKKIIEGQISYSFTLEEDGKLFLNNSKLEPYQMKKGYDIYDVVFYLGRKKDPVTTKDLAQKYKLTPINMRRKLQKIRTEISERFKVPKDAMIKNEPKIGYSIKNLTVKSS